MQGRTGIKFDEISEGQLRFHKTGKWKRETVKLDEVVDSRNRWFNWDVEGDEKGDIVVKRWGKIIWGLMGR